LPEGRGLVAFRTPEEAAEKAQAIERDYGRHCRAAEEVAAEFLAESKAIGEAVG